MKLTYKVRGSSVSEMLLQNLEIGVQSRSEFATVRDLRLGKITLTDSK